MNTAQLVKQAKNLYDQANSNSWELADIYLRLKEEHGWTVRKIAEECEKDKSHVSIFIRCAESCPPRRTRPPFWEAYREIRKPKDRDTPTGSPPPPKGKYRLILADPPWQYDFSETNSRKIENQYPTMTVEQLCKQRTDGSAGRMGEIRSN
jgi:hypothetical protein